MLGRHDFNCDGTNHIVQMPFCSASHQPAINCTYKIQAQDSRWHGLRLRRHDILLRKKENFGVQPLIHGLSRHPCHPTFRYQINHRSRHESSGANQTAGTSYLPRRKCLQEQEQAAQRVLAATHRLTAVFLSGPSESFARSNCPLLEILISTKHKNTHKNT